ncbi:MAG: hypothetical protein WCV84_05090 [Patescibacteria group bacterium]
MQRNTIIAAILGLIAGMAITVLVMAFSKPPKMEPQPFPYPPVSTGNETTKAPESEQRAVGSEPAKTAAELTYFQKYYVNYGGESVRIPLEFCYPLGGDSPGRFNAQCSDTASITLSLREHQLPVDKITSALTDYNHYVAYTTPSTRTNANGCIIQDLFVYDLKTKQTKRMMNADTLWTCGDNATLLHSVSPGEGYIRIAPRGPIGTQRPGVLYDVKHDRIDTLTANSPLHFFFSYDLSVGQEAYVIYYQGCTDPTFTFDKNGPCKPVLTLRNNQTDKSIRLTEIEALWESTHPGDPTLIERLQYRSPTDKDPGTLTLFVDGLGEEPVIINNFNQTLRKVGPGLY